MAAKKSSGTPAARKSAPAKAATPKPAPATNAAPAPKVEPAPTVTVDTSKVALSDRPGVADTEGLSQDNLTAAAAKDMDASGAFIEPEIKSRIDVDHPAVDNNPRAGTTVDQNRIDFNDPTKPGHEAVADNLKNQG